MQRCLHDDMSAQMSAPTASRSWPSLCQCIRGWLALAWVLVWVLTWPTPGLGHGGVVLEDDLCLINVGFYQAHFTVFQPTSRAHKQFCEDLPDLGESIFVLEYLHDGLGALAVDFRIITNPTGMGRFTAWTDIEQLADIEAVTVFYQPHVINPDVFSVLHNFTESGEFVGIVTAIHPDGKTYRAIFPFEVGFELDDYSEYAMYVIGLAALAFWVVPVIRSRLKQRAHKREAGL